MNGSEYAWVIERYEGDTLVYWTGENIAMHRYPWSKDSNRALRFTRKQDGECMLTWHCGGIGRVVEHGWLPARAAGETSRG